MEICINACNMSNIGEFEGTSMRISEILTFSLFLLSALWVYHGRINWKLGQWFSKLLALGPLYTLINYCKLQSCLVYMGFINKCFRN